MTNFLKLFFLLLTFLCNKAFSQNSVGDLNATLSVEDLYSTHGTHFTGVSAGVNRFFSKKFSAGINMEYSHSRYHDDNGWNLYNLNFIPVYLSQNFHFIHLKKFHPYLRLQEGLSLMSYNKEEQKNTGSSVRVKEKGFYGYAGLGADYSFNNKLGLFAEAGLKAFRLSGNDLDVNPHGITGKIGVKYNFR